MARYSTPDQIKSALRVPAAGSTSWSDGSYDALLELVALEADQCVDDLCPGWAPFDTAVKQEDRTFIADGAAVYGILVTDPFTVMPTSLEMRNHALGWGTSEWEEVELKYTALHPVTATRPGKSLELEYGTASKLHPGAEYVCKGGTWGWKKVPPEVTLAAVRIATRSFAQLRNFQGVIESEGALMYEPRYDSFVARLLKRYSGGEVV